MHLETNKVSICAHTPAVYRRSCSSNFLLRDYDCCPGFEEAVPWAMGMIKIDSLRDNEIPIFGLVFLIIYWFVMTSHIV